jgi:hypothetical protein
MTGVGEFATAAGSVAHATAHVSNAFANIAVVTSTGVLNVASEAWKGVDLNGLRVDMEKGAVVLDYLGDFRSFVEATSKPTFRFSNYTRADAYKLIESAWISSPFIDVEKSYLYISAGYERLGLQISLLPSASWLIRWTISRVGFEPQWANPVWSLFSVPYRTRREANT